MHHQNMFSKVNNPLIKGIHFELKLKKFEGVCIPTRTYLYKCLENEGLVFNKVNHTVIPSSNHQENTPDDLVEEMYKKVGVHSRSDSSPLIEKTDYSWIGSLMSKFMMQWSDEQHKVFVSSYTVDNQRTAYDFNLYELHLKSVITAFNRVIDEYKDKHHSLLYHEVHQLHQYICHNCFELSQLNFHLHNVFTKLGVTDFDEHYGYTDHSFPFFSLFDVAVSEIYTKNSVVVVKQ